VTVRTVRQTDVALIEEMHERLSKESIHFRYLGPYKPTPQDLEQLCSLDGSPGAAIVATVQDPQEKVVGMACYKVDPLDPATAEPAILVEDRYQGRGLGKKMILALLRQARTMGLETFVSYVDLTNRKVLCMVKGCGLPHESRYSYGMMEIRVSLQPVS
jgi:GNAT superfamily N-acetyltransferase